MSRFYLPSANKRMILDLGVYGHKGTKTRSKTALVPSCLCGKKNYPTRRFIASQLITFF